MDFGGGFELVRQIGFWALVVNFVVCVLAVFFGKGGTDGDGNDFNKLCA
jgi:hypothetical protein